MSEKKLTEKEYKNLVIQVAIQISPILIDKKGATSDVTGESVALYARDIADAVDEVLIRGLQAFY